nr:MAG TPA: hypothetical protein [Caudoviricetes sp.]
MIFCAVCRLTFCWRWCIMKIRPLRAAEEGIVHFDEKKRGALPLLAPTHIQKLEQIFVLVRKCDRMSAIICQMFGVNIPPHALDNFNRGGFTVSVQKLKPYCFCHSIFLSAFPLN